MKPKYVSCGFEEIAHTADWAMRVWAPDFPRLAETALNGMFSLMSPKLDSAKSIERLITVSGADQTELLVAFLAEALYLLESESMAPQTCKVFLMKGTLSAILHVKPIASITKMIKAVTFHNLEIKETPFGMETTLVFDV